MNFSILSILISEKCLDGLEKLLSYGKIIEELIMYVESQHGIQIFN